MNNQLNIPSSHPIAMVALDLDGTLMGRDLSISPRVCKVVRAVQRAGVITTLATGRMFSATLPFARILDIERPLICYQGGWIQAIDGDVLLRKTLPNALVKSALALGRLHNWHTVLYADGTISVEEFCYSDSFYEQLLGFDIEINPDLESVLLNRTADKVLYVGEPADISAMAAILVPMFHDKAEVVQSHSMFIEIVPLNVNKGKALAWLASYYEIPRNQVMAIGDQQNDVSMLSFAGLGVAMGNAVPEALDAADWIAPELCEDGAAVALEKYILNGGGS